MSRLLEIPTSTLCDGHVEEISELVDPEVLGADEPGIFWGKFEGEEQRRGDPDLLFRTPVRIEGRLYAAESHFVLELTLETTVELPCVVCNAWVACPLIIKGVRVIREGSLFPKGYWEISGDVREALVVEVPRLAECEGSCPRREELNKYLRREEEERQSPFSDL